MRTPTRKARAIPIEVAKFRKRLDTAYELAGA